jgi:hypothetical protein
VLGNWATRRSAETLASGGERIGLKTASRAEADPSIKIVAAADMSIGFMGMILELICP